MINRALLGKTNSFESKQTNNDNDIKKPIDLGDANSPDAPWMNDKK